MRCCRSFASWALVVALLPVVVVCAVLAKPVFAQRPKALQPVNPPKGGGGGRAESGGFKVGEKVEVWELGKYFPGKVTGIEGFSGWLHLEYTVDGEVRTRKFAPQEPWVKKIAGGAAAPAKAAAAAPVAAAPKEYPARTWTDSTGKFKIDAAYVGQDAAGVQLKKSDGSVITIGLDKLSKEDQAFLQGIAAAAAPVNPFEAAAAVAASAPAVATPDLSAPDREANWQTGRRIAIQPKSSWSLTPDPAPALAVPAEPRVIALDGTGNDTFAKGPGGGRATGPGNFFESPRQILFDPSKRSALVAFVNAPPGAARKVRLIRCDLSSGRTNGEITYIGPTVPVDISPSGNFVLGLPDKYGGAHSDRAVEISKIEGKSTKLTRRWNMGEFANHAQRFDNAYFIGDDKLLAWSSWGGVASLWNIEAAECIWSVTFTAHTTPALSPGRQQLALATSDGVAILDTATGDTLAQIDTHSGRGTLAFSPDGKRFGCSSKRQVAVWDLTTGKPTHEVWFPKQMRASSLDFLGGNFVLLDDHYLVDLSKRIVLWDYQVATVRAQTIATLAGGRYWYVRGGQSGEYQLASTSLPDAAAKSKGDSLVADKLLAVKPGTRINLLVNLPGSDDEIRKATKNLKDQIQANGLVLDPDASLSLEATINDAGAQTVKYSRFHFGRDGEEATVNKQVTLLSLKENGTEIWTASGSFGAPSLVRQKQGQSIQDAVNEQKANPIQFFYNITLPKYLARHPEEGTYGSSKLN